MNIITLSISTPDGVKTLDLFPNETIALNSSIQNIKDVSKVFTDFSQPFTVPASATNNNTFKHYYNINIDYGFNAQVSLDSLIEINHLPYKKGKLKLLGVNMVNGEVDSYRLTFIGQLKTLSDKFGDDTLNVLDLSSLTHISSAEIIKGLITGSGDYTYPLISNEKNWTWNTQAINNLSGSDIKYSTDNVSGIKYTELKPAVRVNTLMSAIQSKYGITFSNDFINTSSHFNDLFIYANRELTTSDSADLLKYKDVVIGGQTEFPYELGIVSSNTIWNNYTYSKIAYSLTITPTDSTEYSIMINGNDETTHSDGLPWTYSWTEDTYSSGTNKSGKVKIQWKSNQAVTFTASLTSFRSWTRKNSNRTVSSGTDTIVYGPTTNLSGGDTVIISDGREGKGILPNIKIIDFLNGLIKMFNLVIEPITDTSFRIQTLDDWYADGVSNDITEFLKTDFTVDRPTLPGKISFIYEKSNTISGKKYFELYNKGYGDLIMDSNETGSLLPPFDGPKLDIKIPFENFVGDTLVDTFYDRSTDVFVGKLIDIDSRGESRSVSTKPILFYNCGITTPLDGPISYINSAGYTEPLYSYNVFKNTNNLQNNLINHSLNFGDEIDTYTTNGTSFLEPPKNPASAHNLKYSLYSIYWEDYISDLYDSKRRVFNYTGTLPIHKLIGMKLNDKIVISDTQYIINNLQTNLTTGDVKLELLNDIYLNTDTGSVHAVINASNSRITCAEPTVSLTGINSKGVDRTYQWTTSDGTIDTSTTANTITVSAAGTYTLTVTDLYAVTDNHSYTISDIRSTPSLTITPSISELTFNAPTASISSSLSSGYELVWTYTDGTGSIVSGQGTNEIIVDSAGTYSLLATQNNTGCFATDNTTITGGDLDLPTVPVGLFVLNSTTSSINLVWSPSTDSYGIQDYDIFVDGAYYTSSVSESQEITGLTENIIYKLNVLSRDNSNYTSSLSDSLYAKAYLIESGLSGLTIILSNEAHTLPTTSLGLVTYTGSGTTISLYEGSTALAFDGVGTSVGTWTVSASGSNITPGGTTDAGTYVTYANASNMTQTNATITYTITGKRANGDAISIIKVQSFAKSVAGTNGLDGSSGTDAKTVSLISDKYVITYDANGVETPAGQVCNLTATQQNHAGTVYYEFARAGVVKQNTTTSTYQIVDADEPVGGAVILYTVKTRENSSIGTVIATDSVDIFGVQDGTPGLDGEDGLDGLTFIMTNEAHTFAASSAGVVSSYAGSGTALYAFEGVTPILYDGVGTSVGTFKITPTATSITTGTITDSGDYVTIGQHNTMTADYASISYLIEGKRLSGTAFSLRKQQSFAKSRFGVDGTDGVDGTNGTNGSKTTTGFVYLQAPTATATPVPATPTATSFNFSTFEFTSLTAGWLKTPPTATGGGIYWVSPFTVTETTALGGVGVPSFSTARQSLQFTEIVTFTDLSTSDPTNTIINGSNITTGVIQSANYTTGTAPYSSAGTKIDLSDGTITSKAFAINTAGSAFFSGSVAGGTIDIGGADASSFHVDTAGNMWTGGATLATSKFSVTSAGIASAFDSFYCEEGIIDNNGGGTSKSAARIIFGNALSNNAYMYSQKTIASGGALSYKWWQSTKGWTEWEANNAASSYYMKFGRAGAGDLECTGNIVAYYSDERLKTITGNLENPLDKINTLNGFTYVNNELAESFGYIETKQQVGISAQQIQKVLPEAVSLAPFDTDDDGTSKSGEKYLTVDYSKIVPLLIEGIKELSSEVDKLKEEIKKLKG